MKNLLSVILLLIVGCSGSNPTGTTVLNKTFTAMDLQGSWTVDVEGIGNEIQSRIETTLSTVWIDVGGFKTFKNAKYGGRTVTGSYRDKYSSTIYLDYDIDLTISDDGKSFEGGVLVSGTNTSPIYQHIIGKR